MKPNTSDKMIVGIQRWTDPPHYAGSRWPEYFSAGVGQSRDSKPLEQSNFRSMLRLLGGETDTVIVVRESHWAVGWVEWIAIHETDTVALQAADKAIANLEDYPVLDDDDFYSLETEQIVDWWASEDLRWRMDRCRLVGVSLFAARRNFPSDEVYDSLRENL